MAYNFVLHHDLTVQPQFQWTFPAGNDAGSQRAGQELAVEFLKTLNDNWEFSVTPAIDRDTEGDARRPEYGKSVSAKLAWKRAAKSRTGASIELTRERPADDSADTHVSAEFDFPLCKKLDGSFILSRTVSDRNSANTAEFDLTWSF